MSSLKDKITSKVTGDAYDKPAMTKDGAFTTQDSEDAHTIEGTSADPNSTGSGTADKAQEKLDQAGDKASETTDKAKQTADQAGDKANEAGDKANQKADELK